MADQNVYVGQIKRTQGIRGEILLAVRKGIVLDIPATKFLLIHEKNAQTAVPWFPERFVERENGLLVKLEGISSEKDAKRFIAARVYAAAEAVNEGTEASVEDFDVIDEAHGNIGKVAAVIEFPAQLILSVLTPENKEILLPLTDIFIKSIDEKNKKLYYKAPEGLLDVYLNPSNENEQDDGDDESEK